MEAKHNNERNEKMENNNIEKLLNEYNKYIISRLIDKEYEFNSFRQMVKKFSEETEIIEYNDNMSNQEVLNNVNKLIQENIYGKKFEVD